MSDTDLRSSFGGKSVLVTGATGFIGARLAQRLHKLGAGVVATYRTETLDQLDVHWIRCDLEKEDDVARVVKIHSPDVVFHLASHVVGARDLEVVRSTFTSNLTSTVNLLIAAAEQGVSKTVLAGSLEEPEGDAQRAVPSSPYAAAKWAAGGYARMFHALYGLDVSVARIFMVYGPGQRDRRKLVPYTITSLLKGQAPELTSGTRPVDWIYVDDVVEGLIRIGASPRTAGARVDLGSGRAVTVRGVVERLHELIPDSPAPQFGAVGDRPMEQVRVAELEHTREVLGWAPDTALDTGLQATIQWYGERLEDA